jgi:hypothetical protein
MISSPCWFFSQTHMYVMYVDQPIKQHMHLLAKAALNLSVDCVRMEVCPPYIHIVVVAEQV